MEVPRLERKLVAILAADIAGYSRHMEQDEVATLAILSAHRVLTDGLIDRFNGRITGTAGDSVLAEFASVVDAVDCAVEIQRAVEAASRDTPPEKRLLFRIGVNVGDVMVKDGDIFGDGVNVAARLESLADPGGICVSRGVRDHLRKHSAFVFEDLGEQSVKNIAQAIRAFRVLYDGTGVAPAEPGTASEAGATGETEPKVADPTEIAFWESIKDGGDETEFQAYLEQYPGGAFARLARSRIDGLDRSTDTDAPEPTTTALELAFWESVKDSSSEAEFASFLDRFPGGTFAALARTRLEALSSPEPAQSPAKPPADMVAVELAFWDSVKDSDNPAMLEAYLGQYPEGSFAPVARVRLAELVPDGGRPLG